MKSPVARLGPRGVAVALVALAFAGACSSLGRNHSAAVRGPGGMHGVVLSKGLPKPNFTLTDTTGRSYDFVRETEGYTTLLYFGYTHCPDVCPTHMANIALALQRVPDSVSSHVKVVFVTTDPARDTPSGLRTWLDNFNPTFIGLTGTDQQIQAAEAAAGLPPSAPDTTDRLPDGSYSVGHGAQVEVFTTDDLAHVEYPSGYEASDWVNDLPKLVRGWPDG